MPPAQEIVRNDGYVLEHMPSHPLWGDTHGRIYQHRRVFYDAYGKGPFACHWCGTCVDWGNVQVDRVNAIRSDNALSNLVASCANCNQKRGHDKMKATQQAKIEWQGECLTAGQWAERIGISRQSLMHRLRSGWDLGRALTEGRGVTGPK
jgi:L-lactate utilization protein LutB